MSVSADLLVDFAVIASNMLRTRIVRETVFVTGCRNPSQKYSNVLVIEPLLKAHPFRVLMSDATFQQVPDQREVEVGSEAEAHRVVKLLELPL